MGEQNFSGRVSWYNYMLCFLVVWVHAVNAADTSAALAALAKAPSASPCVRAEYLLSDVLAQLAVPAFFMLSAYLFYRNLHGYDMIWKKLGRRCKSLLLPYCAWNAIYYLLHVAVGDAPLSVQTVFSALAFYQYNPVFWYLFQLILLTALAPLLYPLLRNARVCAVLPVFVLLMIKRQWDVPYLNEDALFYYLIGAAAALHQRRLTEEGQGSICVILFALAGLCGMAMGKAQTAGLVILLTVLVRAFMAVGLWFLLGLTRKQLPASVPFWARNTFFIYATHYLLIRLLAKLFAAAYAKSDGVKLMMFLLMPMLCTLFAALLAAFLKRFAPWLWRLLSGGR